MKVRIKTIDKNPLFYETKGACAFDFKASEDIIIKPQTVGLVETGTVIETPKNYVLELASRSSTFNKLGLILVNGVGIIDQDYCGETDTIKFQYLNMTNKEVLIKKGDRIGQGIFLKIGIADFEIVSEMKNKSRGGFGTTGIR